MHCSVEGCQKEADRPRMRMCEAHYMRQRRHGHTDRKIIGKPQLLHSAGYIVCLAPEHPLAVRRHARYEYQHRIVFFDAHGEGPFACHVCGKAVGWHDMHVDHLNDVKVDNRIENLSAACEVCNPWRASERAGKIGREKTGKFITHAGRTLCINEWAREVGVRAQSLKWRLRAGWSLERALTEGRGRTGPIARARA